MENKALFKTSFTPKGLYLKKIKSTKYSIQDI